jgi:hypothetical protein
MVIQLDNLSAWEPTIIVIGRSFLRIAGSLNNGSTCSQTLQIQIECSWPQTYPGEGVLGMLGYEKYLFSVTWQGWWKGALGGNIKTKYAAPDLKNDIEALMKSFWMRIMSTGSQSTATTMTHLFMIMSPKAGSSLTAFNKSSQRLQPKLLPTSKPTGNGSCHRRR